MFYLRLASSCFPEEKSRQNIIYEFLKLPKTKMQKFDFNEKQTKIKKRLVLLVYIHFLLNFFLYHGGAFVN